MTSTEKQIKTRRTVVIVAIALITMIGIASFAVSFSDGNVNAGSVGTIPAGASVDSSGTVTALKVFQWTPDCDIVDTGVFTTVLAECNAHIVITKFTATKGDSETLTISHLQCYASAPVAMRVTATVGSGLLVDLQDTADIKDPGPRVVGTHEWIATVKNCDVNGGNNEVQLKVDVIESGSSDFSISVEPL